MPYGNLYFGENGFFYKKMDSSGNHHDFSLAAVCNQPHFLNNKHVRGASVRPVKTANKRAMKKRSLYCHIVPGPIVPAPLIPSIPSIPSILALNKKQTYTTMAISKDGSIYAIDGINGGGTGLFAYNSDGSNKWISPFLLYESSEGSSLTIGSDGTIYVSDTNCYFYAITDYGSYGLNNPNLVIL